MTERRRLPFRRVVQTFELHHQTQIFQVSVGYFEDNKPAEVFVTGAKVGSNLEAVARDAAVLLSLAMQFDVPLETIKGAVTRDSTNQPSSIIGAIVDKLLTEEEQC